MTNEIVSIDTEIHSTDVLRYVETDGAHELPVVKVVNTGTPAPVDSKAWLVVPAAVNA